jgi:hypothetical protein
MVPLGVAFAAALFRQAYALFYAFSDFERRGPRFFSLTALPQNALPDAVDGLLELGSRCGSHLVQVRLRRAAHDHEVLFRHAAHDRIPVQQFGRLADRSNPWP